MNKQLKRVLLFALNASLCLSVGLSAAACKVDSRPSVNEGREDYVDGDYVNSDDKFADTFEGEKIDESFWDIVPADEKVLSTKFVQPTAMPYHAEWLDTNYPRQKYVEVKNEGLTEYPKYGTVFSTKGSQARKDVAIECKKLAAGNTPFYGSATDVAGWPFYDMMDSEGNLLKLNGATSPAGAVDSGMDLYKHTAAEGMYFGNVSGDEPAVVKRITVNGKTYGTVMTGLYAPAGEVVKVVMPADGLRDRNIYISIGQTSGSGRAISIPAGTDKKFIRMPIIGTRYCMNKKTSYYDEASDTYTCYVGSHFGGPIYLLPTNAKSKNDNTEYTCTIYGAVNYRHFILGVTTKEEFDYVSKSTAPYFDLEAGWMQGVRHSGALRYASSYSYDQLKNAAELWEKIGLVSNQVPNWCQTGGNIIYCYDDFVPSGAAVAICGNRTVCAPYGWLTNSLNYEYFVTNGSWGNIHEYNHHYQKFGLSGDSNEITNNALNLLEYALFTKISAHRTLDGGLGGWNAYTMPQFGLQYLVNTNKTADQNGTARKILNSLHIYAALLHNIGTDAFLAAASKTGSNATAFYKNLCDAAHLDMTYYFTEMLNYSVDNIGGADAVAAIKANNYPVFVPVNTVYQVGRVWKKDGVKQYARTAQPFIYGTGDYTLDFENYLVIPQGFTYKIKSVTQPESGSVIKVDDTHLEYKAGEENLSGEFFVTLEVKNTNNAFAVEDVELIINLQKDNILQRTTWTYESGNLPDIKSGDDLVAFYNKLKPTDANAEVGENINANQNGNAEIWGGYAQSPNSIMEVKGSLYINSTGKYRIAIRGRKYAALFLSYDGGKTYSTAVKLTTAQNSQATFLGNNYVDVELKEGSWVNFKAVVYNDISTSYVGLGIGKFGADADGETSSDSVTLAYASAYRDESFLPETYFAPSYATLNYNYTYNQAYSAGQKLVDSKNAESVTENPTFTHVNTNDRLLSNVFDDDETNCFWSSGNKAYSAQNPFEITVDIGKTVTANRFTIYYPTDKNFANYYATAFKVYAGETQDDMKLVFETDNAAKANNMTAFSLEKPINVRYYKLVVTDAPRGDKQFVLRKLEWTYTATGNLLAPEAKALDYYELGRVKERAAITYYGEWQTRTAKCSFGTLKTGTKTSGAKFAFEGKQLAVLSAFGEEYGSFEVYIDGIKAGTADLSQGSGTGVAFISGLLEEGTHTVMIKGSEGTFNIDSFVLF